MNLRVHDLLSLHQCRATIHIGQGRGGKRSETWEQKSVIVEMRKQQTERSLKPHEQYNTRCAIPLLHNAICRKIWRSKGKQEVQQEPVIHLLLEETVWWKHGIASVPVKTAAQPSRHKKAGHTMCNLLSGSLTRNWYNLAKCPDGVIPIQNFPFFTPGESSKIQVTSIRPCSNSRHRSNSYAASTSEKVNAWQHGAFWWYPCTHEGLQGDHHRKSTNRPTVSERSIGTSCFQGHGKSVGLCQGRERTPSALGQVHHE